MYRIYIGIRQFARKSLGLILTAFFAKRKMVFPILIQNIIYVM